MFVCRDGDLIFVHARMGTRFREEILPYITTKFILITHEHDIPPRDMAIMLEDPKLIHWFAQNPDLVHEKVTPIPIGTTAKFASRAGEFTAFR